VIWHLETVRIVETTQRGVSTGGRLRGFAETQGGGNVEYVAVGHLLQGRQGLQGVFDPAIGGRLEDKVNALDVAEAVQHEGIVVVVSLFPFGVEDEGEADVGHRLPVARILQDLVEETGDDIAGRRAIDADRGVGALVLFVPDTG